MGLFYKYLKTSSFILLTFLPVAFSQTKIDTADSTSAIKEGGWFAVPYAGYSPETEWAFGVAGLFYFYIEPPPKQKSRLSNFLPSVEFTTKEQMTIELDYDLYLDNDEYRFYGSTGYSKYPFLFYGIGNNTSEEDEESYTAKYFYLESVVIKNIISKNGSGLNAGIRYDFRNDKISGTKDDGLLSSGNVTGHNGGIISGFGLTVNWDTRDNTFSTLNGEYLEINGSFFGKYFFSDYNFNIINFDARKFFGLQVFDTLHVAAFQFAVSSAAGEVPFYKLMTFGGDENMRGFFQGRFRDKTSFYLQGEYRLHVWWRIGLAAFGGLGEVSSKVSTFAINNLKAAYGLGLRFSIIPEERILARIDLGFSEGESKLYLSFNEAF